MAGKEKLARPIAEAERRGCLETIRGSGGTGAGSCLQTLNSGLLYSTVKKEALN